MKAEVYVFSREENLDLIMKTFCDCFGIERRDGSNQLCLENNVQKVEIYASPGGMEPGVVQARHKTLNWLICFGDADWDSVDIPT
ncbi:MAG: DUF4272 domain-containing protein [Lachnospiraceae bacterium]|nr:DUF4272 domain-containing protein [Lachnospiraceae bacterium]